MESQADRPQAEPEWKEKHYHSDDVESVAAWPTADDDRLEEEAATGHADITDVKESRGNIITRQLSRQSRSSAKDPGPPPDGGTAAWTQVAMAHLTIFVVWGNISSFGVYQTYFQGSLGLQPSAISWLGSVQIFLLFFLGTFTGRALDAGLFRACYVAGAVLQVVGFFSMSVSTTYWQLFLSQALCLGIANGLQFCPVMALLSTYFVKKRALALGMAALGSCTGGIVFPVLVQQLLPRVGFGWTIRVCGFVVLLTNIITSLVYKTRLPPRKSGPIFEWSAFKELSYSLFIVSMFFNFFGLYFAFYYIGTYGRNILGMSYSSSINLLLTMVGIGFLFRVIPNYLAVLYGPLNLILPFCLLCGIMMFGWIGVRSVPSLYIFATFYGAGSAGLQSLFPAGLASLTDDLSKAGVRMGMGFSVVSFACLTGPPLAGALVQQADGEYLYAQIWGGISFMVGTALLLGARTARVGWKLNAKI